MFSPVRAFSSVSMSLTDLPGLLAEGLIQQVFSTIGQDLLGQVLRGLAELVVAGDEVGLAVQLDNRARLSCRGEMPPRCGRRWSTGPSGPRP